VGQLDLAVYKQGQTISHQLRNGKNSITSRTCRQVRDGDPSLTSGMYWIDPDGQGIGDGPIYVYCDMATGFIEVQITLNYLHETLYRRIDISPTR
jgi:hypothetical protein